MSISNDLRNKFSQLATQVERAQNHSKKFEVLSNFKSTPTIISRDLKIKGEVFSSGIIEIEGSIDGTIKGNVVILREEGTINGTIFAENLNIKGKFEGIIKAKSINIANKAKITGEIEYENLSVEDGACVDGKFKKSLNPSKSS